MLAVERRNLILEKLQQDKRVVVSELSQTYNVSEETIRRDLDKLDRDGLAVKSYGGAIINENTNIDVPFNVRKKRNVVGKQRIADIIADLVEDGEHIILDPSTTAVFIAKALKEKNHLTVITNSIEVLIELSDVEGWEVISTGGNLKSEFLALVGPRAMDGLAAFNVEKVIFSCKGIDLEKGITDANELFSQAKQTMIKSARCCILAVDQSKFDKIAFSKISNINKIDMIVTDVKPSNQWLEYFAQNEVECRYPISSNEA